ncbi:MAG: glutamate racemase [Oxalobacter formigenes]|nr:glutamate racemase [Oxalobacter formigenes]
MELTERPIGIFDSGIGGLSVLRHIRAQLPDEDLRYFADSGFAPYGEKPEEIVIRRSMEIARFLFECHCKALVIACNTATAAAIHLLRKTYPAIPIVGVEPGLKPAAAVTQSRIVGVLATERTLKSRKFNNLHRNLSRQTGVRFIMQPAPGLAALVEKNERRSAHAEELVNRYVRPLIEQGADTLVLGCTHYPFLRELIEKTLADAGAPSTRIIDTGVAVTRQLIRLLDQHGLKKTGRTDNSGIHALTTGDTALLAEQFGQLLHIHPDITGTAIQNLPNQPCKETK